MTYMIVEVINLKEANFKELDKRVTILEEHLQRIYIDIQKIKEEKPSNLSVTHTDLSQSYRTKVEYLSEVNEQLAQQNQRLRKLIEENIEKGTCIDKVSYFKAIRGDT